ncbi:uncharacterized protein K02A2.6-like [Camponotus floridanus]|uniref:uncharacterized protein K02A2.6-like n=1 Tax=Camponotus floridanus TaxID=104421 RepID=UPI000DC6A649|nr:uncharacterized protein K02A2.6-like [Camponotus floridanus]
MRVEGQRFSEINAVSQSTNNSSKKKGKYYEKKTSPTTLHYKKKTNSTTLSPCYGCDSTKHRRDACPFKNAECRKCRICKKTGHIARICLSKQRNKINTVTLQGILGTRYQYRKFVHITINKKPLKMQLDTGGDVTTIGREIWTRIGHPKLQPLTTSCMNVSGHPMHTIGFFNALFGYKDCMIKAPVIVLDRPETALISSQAIDELGLIASDDRSHAKPKHIPRRPIALALEEPVNEKLDRLVKNGILTPVDFSEWAAPIVVARKANGKICICADYSTGLNDALDAEDYPIPGIEELMAKLRGSSIFSQLDLSDAYFHLRLDEESKKLTTINTYRGLFAYNRLVFGLKPAPAIIQRTLEQALTDIPGVLVYLDNILIYGQERTEHAFIHPKGIEPDPARLRPIQTMRTPTNAKEIRSFLADASSIEIGGVLGGMLGTARPRWLALFKTSNTKGLDTRTVHCLKRWALRLIGYDFDTEYVNSEKFGQADAFSRLIQDVKQDVIDADLEEVVAALQETNTELQQIVNKLVHKQPSKRIITSNPGKSFKESLHLNPGKSWSRLHIDFAGPIHGQRVLVIVDSYSKFVEAGWFSTITSAATCRYLRRLFSRYGPPEVLVSDNGIQFTSVEFAQLCAEFRILHLRTPPGHSQSNGQAERMVRTLKSSIDTSQSSQLETELNKFVYAYNYTPSDAVPDLKSPAEIFFGRKLRTPLDIFTATEKPNLSLTSRQKQIKQQFDTHHGERPSSFVIGQSRQEKKSNTISEDLLPSGKESARTEPDPVFHTSLGEREEAEPLNNGTTQPLVAVARRSERLSHRL